MSARTWPVGLFLTFLVTLGFGQACRQAETRIDAQKRSHLSDVASQAKKRGETKVSLRQLVGIDTESSLDEMLSRSGMVIATASDSRTEVGADSIFTWQFMITNEWLRQFRSQPIDDECRGPSPPSMSSDSFVVRLSRGSATVDGVEITIVDEHQTVFQKGRRYLMRVRECPGNYLVRPWGEHGVFEVDNNGRISLPLFNAGVAAYAKELISLGTIAAIRTKIASARK